MRRAKIVCTLGPASSTRERIGELIEAGMDVARLNASHGTQEDHAKRIHLIREQAEAQGRAVAILLDLQGPKIRVGTFKDGSVELRQGQEFTITTDRSVIGDEHKVSTTYAGLAGDVRVGDQILLDDGYLALAVTEVNGHDVKTVVVTGGVLKNSKGINLPHVQVSAPALSDKDRSDLAFGCRMGVEYIALSFVRTPECVREARRLALVDGSHIPIIAKLEKPEAIERLTDIVAAADGIMVARGDLGVEMGPEKVPLIQKRIIEETNRQGKIVITATQMLESMIQWPRPTRAEASDVANAVLDGTDALMLSGETAAGKYPVEAVRTMSRIITEIEQSSVFRAQLEPPSIAMAVPANAIAHAATIAAREMNINVVVVVTNSGGAARLISEYRPEAKIVALTANESTYRRLALYWGVVPVMTSTPAATLNEMQSNIAFEVIERGLAEPGEHVVITLGAPIGSGATTNTLKIHQIPE